MFLFPFFSFCSRSAKHVMKTRKGEPLFPLPKSERASLSGCWSQHPWDDLLSPSDRLRCLPRPSVTGCLCVGLRTQDKSPFGNVGASGNPTSGWQGLSQREL